MRKSNPNGWLVGWLVGLCWVVSRCVEGISRCNQIKFHTFPSSCHRLTMLVLSLTVCVLWLSSQQRIRAPRLCSRASNESEPRKARETLKNIETLKRQNKWIERCNERQNYLCRAHRQQQIGGLAVAVCMHQPFVAIWLLQCLQNVWSVFPHSNGIRCIV